MRASWIIAIAVIVGVAACGDGTGPRRPLTLQFCSLVAVVAMQDGRGDWIAAGSGTTVTIPALPHIALAVAYPNNTGLTLYYVSAEEAANSFTCPQNGDPGNRTVNVSVRGLNANEFGMIHTPGNLHIHVPADFPLCCLPPRPADIVAWTQRELPNGFPSLERMIIRRDQFPENNTTLPVLDFASAEAFTPVATTLTLSGAPSGTPIFAQNDFISADTIFALTSVDSSSTGSLTVRGVPADKLEADDKHILRVDGGNRNVTVVYHAPTDRTVTFGPAMTRPTFSLADTRLHVQLPVQPEYSAQFNLTVFDDAGHTFSITASRAYLDGSASSWMFTIPDLSHIMGFGTRQPTGGFTFSAYVSSMPWTSRTLEARAGDVFRTASSSGRQETLPIQ